MKYIKFENGKAIEAPAVKKTEAGTIFGYNNEKNEKRLLADGWMKYDGNAPLSRLKFENGEIVETTPAPIAVEKKCRTTFTKLEIRRALRKLGKESDLDRLLGRNAQFFKDWNDAQVIDIKDEMVQTAIDKGLITKEFINTLIKELN